MLLLQCQQVEGRGNRTYLPAARHHKGRMGTTTTEAAAEVGGEEAATGAEATVEEEAHLHHRATGDEANALRLLEATAEEVEGTEEGEEAADDLTRTEISLLLFSLGLLLPTSLAAGGQWEEHLRARRGWLWPGRRLQGREPLQIQAARRLCGRIFSDGVGGYGLTRLPL